MKKLNLYKKVIAMLSGISLIFTSVSTFYTPFIVFADGDPPSQSLVEALDPVTELHWVEDSSATVTWTVSAEANYYAVTVDVYESDGITFIGSSETGTTATEIDVQQEIHNVIGDAEYDVVKVKATVIAQKKQDDVVVAESDGITTGMWMYLLNIIQIPTPTKIELSEDLILTFECDIANPANIISQNYGYAIKFDNGYGCMSGGYGIIWNGQKGTIDVENGISSIYKDALQSGSIDKDVYVSISIQLYPQDEGYYNSDESDYSNMIDYHQSLIQIPTPTKIELSEDLILTFECDIANPANIISQNYGYAIKFDNGYGCMSGGYGIIWNGQKGTIDVENGISSIYKDALQSGSIDKDVYVSISIQLYPQDEGYYNSDESDYSNMIDYHQSLIQIPTPTKIELSEDLILTFECDIANPANIISQNYGYAIKFDNGYGCMSGGYGVIWNGQKGTIDVENEISSIYKDALQSGSIDKDVYVSISIQLYPQDEGYYNSDESDYSNSVIYNGKKYIRALLLAPSNPIISKGNSYYLGKTIEPIDAYYENIDWTSEDTSVVTVDNDGKITGVEVGIKNVKAAIGDVTDSVPVTVYEINSNITNEDDKDEIIDTAGDIIDDIANNENPDISNTDIDENDLDDLQEEIIDAAQNGAEFWINFKDKGRGLGHYQDYWNDPEFWEWYQSKYGTGNGWHLGWGKDVVYEMGYTDSNGQDHTIGNITEFDKKYGFEFEIPDDAEIEELKNGKKRIYNVIRIHDGQFEVVDVEVDKHGKIKVLSDKYSDFILLYQDVDIADENNVLNAANITLGGELGLNFYVTVPDDVVAAGAKAVMNGPNGEKVFNLSTFTKDDNGRYKVTYKLKAVDIDKKVSFKLTDAEGITLDLIKASGAEIDENIIEYGVYDYVASAKTSSTITDSDMNIINAMYAYGAYSAKWKYGTELPSDVNTDLVTLNKADFEKYALKQEGTNETIALTGASLVLDSNTAFRLYFTVSDDIANHSITLGEYVLTPYETGTFGKYYVDIENIGAGNLKKDYIVTFDSSYSVKVSAMTYVYNYLKSEMNDENLLNLLKSICAYSDAVDAAN